MPFFIKILKEINQTINSANAEENMVENEAMVSTEQVSETSQEEESKKTVRGNYSNASIDNLWKDLK